MSSWNRNTSGPCPCCLNDDPRGCPECDYTGSREGFERVREAKRRASERDDRIYRSARRQYDAP